MTIPCRSHEDLSTERGGDASGNTVLEGKKIGTVTLEQLRVDPNAAVTICKASVDSDTTRPALSDERVQLNAAGQVEFKLKTPWRDGTTHLVMSPLEFMQRLAALVPRPRLHLIRYHGVLAPNAKLRALVVPQGPEQAEQAEQASDVAATGQCEAQAALARPGRISWARLLKRVFDIDMQRCPHCSGGELKIIAAILERPSIEKILNHLGLDPHPPPKARSRQADLDGAN